MKPVEQTRTTPGGGGNCVAACVASIFELALGDVEAGCPDGGDYNALCRWTGERYPALSCHQRIVGGHWCERAGVRRFVDSYPPLDVVEPPSWPSYWIASCISPRGVLQRVDDEIKPSLHAVVMWNTELVWDPSPARDMGVGGCYQATWWGVRDPGALR